MERSFVASTLISAKSRLFRFVDKFYSSVFAAKTQGLTKMDDDAELADQKRQDQGNHECDVWTDGAEGARQWETCIKNPGHLKFIPALDFSMEHLPKEYQDKELFEYIRYLSELTVKITVTYTSNERPDGYPFSKFRGRYISHFGSGCVRYAGKHYDLKVLKRTCPCHACVSSGSPKEMWWDCTVITAKHVVFNDEEVKDAVIELFYEDDERRDRVKLLYGVKVLDENYGGDRCEIQCVTHDKMVADQLRYASDLCLIKHRTFSKGRYPELGNDQANLCVVVSHPHGCRKCITVGRWKNCLKQGEDRVIDPHLETSYYESYMSYTYDTPTCPGSSGGSIFILGLWDSPWTYILAAYYFCHTHKSGKIFNGENANESCYWLVMAASESFDRLQKPL